jgi:hypothetical protein
VHADFNIVYNYGHEDQVRMANRRVRAHVGADWINSGCRSQCGPGIGESVLAIDHLIEKAESLGGIQSLEMIFYHSGLGISQVAEERQCGLPVDAGGWIFADSLVQFSK